jgi:hypothetical protein
MERLPGRHFDEALAAAAGIDLATRTKIEIFGEADADFVQRAG